MYHVIIELQSMQSGNPCQGAVRIRFHVARMSYLTYYISQLRHVLVLSQDVSLIVPKSHTHTSIYLLITTQLNVTQHCSEPYQLLPEAALFLSTWRNCIIHHHILLRRS